MATVEIELDVVYLEESEGLVDVIRQLVKGLEVEAFVTGGSREAAGWPEVRFVGPEADIRALLIRYTAGDEAEAITLFADWADEVLPDCC